MKGKGGHSLFFPIFIRSADMLPGTEQDCEINYDVSQCNFPIWHSTVHVHAVLAGCTRYHKSDRGEAERKRAKSSQGR